MEEKIVRVRINPDVFKEFKKICVELELSVPKQTEALIKHFVKSINENKKYIKGDI